MGLHYTETLVDLYPELLDCDHENLGLGTPWISGYSDGKMNIKYYVHKCRDCNKEMRSPNGVIIEDPLTKKCKVF